MIKRLISGQSKALRSNLRRQLKVILRINLRTIQLVLHSILSTCFKVLTTHTGMTYLPLQEVLFKFGPMRGQAHCSHLNGELTL